MRPDKSWLPAFLALLIGLFLTASTAASSAGFQAKFQWKHGNPLDNRIHGHVVSPPQDEIYLFQPDQIRALSPDTGGVIREIPVPESQSIPSVGPDGTVYIPQDVFVFNGYWAVMPGGNLKWFDNAASNPHAIPAIDKQRNIVYLPYIETLKAVDPDSGTVLDTFADFESGISRTLHSDSTPYGSPVIAPNGSVIFGVGHETDTEYQLVPPKILSVEYTGGDLQHHWEYEPDREIESAFAIDSTRSPPSLYFIDGLTLYSLNVNTGAEQWKYPLNSTDFPDTVYPAPSPVVGPDGTVYIGDNQENVHAVNPDGTRKWMTPLNIPNGDRKVGTITLGDTVGGSILYLGTNSAEDDSQYARLVALDDGGNILWTRKCANSFDTCNSLSFQIRFYNQIPYAPQLLDDGTLVVFNFGIRRCCTSDGFDRTSKDAVFAYQSTSRGPAIGSWPLFRQNAQYDGQAESSSSGETTGGGACLIERTLRTPSLLNPLRRMRDRGMVSPPGRWLAAAYYGLLGPSTHD